MNTALPATALISFVAAFVAGWLVSKIYFSKIARIAGQRAARQTELLDTQRKRYRRRVRLMHEAVARHKLARDQLRDALADAEAHLATANAMTSDLQVRLAVSEARLSELEVVDLKRRRELEMLQEEREHLGDQLRATMEKVSATQYEHGLLRIERDELAAQTQRLTALPRSVASSDTDATDRTADEARAEIGALRERLAERDGLIRQLESKLRERETQASEVGAQLRNWKHRVAPLVFQLRIQRERVRKLRALLNQQRDKFPAVQPNAPPAPMATDDLKQIRGIGRRIERKLRACGIERFRQLAEMAPGDLESMAAQLAIPASRPLRDGWIDQARALHLAKYPDAALFG